MLRISASPPGTLEAWGFDFENFEGFEEDGLGPDGVPGAVPSESEEVEEGGNGFSGFASELDGFFGMFAGAVVIADGEEVASVVVVTLGEKAGIGFGSGLQVGLEDFAGFAVVASDEKEESEVVAGDIEPVVAGGVFDPCTPSQGLSESFLGLIVVAVELVGAPEGIENIGAGEGW